MDPVWDSTCDELAARAFAPSGDPVAFGELERRVTPRMLAYLDAKHVPSEDACLLVKRAWTAACRSAAAGRHSTRGAKVSVFVHLAELWSDWLAQQYETTGQESFLDALAVAAIVETHPSAYTHLFRLTRPRLVRYVQPRLPREMHVDDILQEIWMAINDGKFDSGGRFLPWAFGIAAHKCADAWRATGRKPQVLSGSDDDDPPPVLAAASSGSGGPHGDLLFHEAVAIAMKCMGGLDVTNRDILRLAFFEDRTIREIAAILGKAPGSIGERKTHATAQMLDCMKKMGVSDLAGMR